MSEENNWKWQKELLIKRDKEHQEEIEKLNYIIDKQDRDIVALSNGNRKLKERTDNIINELESYLKYNIETENPFYIKDTFKIVLNRLQELKGDSSNE